MSAGDSDKQHMRQKDVFKLVDETLLTEKRLRNDPHVKFVQGVGSDSRSYRDLARLPPVVAENQKRHNVYVRQLGIDVLETMLSEAKANQLERERALKKQSKVGTLLRKRVKVTDFADGGIAIAIEQDWDTSTWNDNLVEAGCEALLYVFYDLHEVSSLEKKDRALQMLQKLLQRHAAAEVFLRKNLEMLIGKATSRLIRQGVSCGVTNLLHVLNGCKTLFLKELSNYKFNGRAMEMLLVEMQLAAVLIQHTVRARTAKQALRVGRAHHSSSSSSSPSSSPSPHQAVWAKVSEFGTDREEYYRKLRVINARSADLRRAWRNLHPPHAASSARTSTSSYSKARGGAVSRLAVGGLRGPIHMDSRHVLLSLQIMQYLVSDAAESLAHGNREDVVRAGGGILLGGFLGCPASPFSGLAASILAETSQASESFASFLNAGVVQAAFRYMRYARTVHHLGAGGGGGGAGGGTNGVYLAFLACMDIVIHTAQHAAGLYRAHQGYDYVTPPRGTTEATDYRQLLAQLHSSQAIYDLRQYLAHLQAQAHRRHVLNPFDAPPSPAADASSAAAAAADFRVADLQKRPRGHRRPTPVHDSHRDQAVAVAYYPRGTSVEQMLEEATSLLADSYLLQELATILHDLAQPSLLRRALLCVLSLLSCHAHGRMVQEITARGGRLLRRLVSLLAHPSPEVSFLVTAVFQQLHVRHASRQAVWTSNVARYLLDLQHAAVQPYLPPASSSSGASGGGGGGGGEAGAASYGYLQDGVFQRSLLLTASLCRQFDWRLYDPLALVQHPLLSSSSSHRSSSNSTSSAAGAGGADLTQSVLRTRLFLDLLISMKVSHVLNRDDAAAPPRRAGSLPRTGRVGGGGGAEEGEGEAGGVRVHITNDTVHSLGIADWVVLPNDFSLCLRLSQQLAALHPPYLVHFLLHPEDAYAYERMPLHESVAVCEVLEGLTAFQQTARYVYSPAVVHFLSRFIFLHKFIFQGAPLDALRVNVLLQGVKSAFIALGRMVLAIQESDSAVEECLQTVQQEELLANAVFFLDTLAVFHPDLPFALLQVQKQVGIVVCEFFAKLATAVSLQAQRRGQGKGGGRGGSRTVARMEDLYAVGKIAVQLLHKLHHTYQVYFTHHPEHRGLLRNEEIHIHDKLCTLLCAICVYKDAAYTALSDWNIQAALKRYMPPPLSGLPNISHGGKFKSFIRTSTSNLNVDIICGDSPKKRGSMRSSLRVRNRQSIAGGEGGEIGDGAEQGEENAASSPAGSPPRRSLRPSSQSMDPLLQLEGEMHAEDFFPPEWSPNHRQYALELLELPASFFELCANLGQIDTGLSFCVNSGFLRRAMDKLMILHLQLQQAREIYPQQFLQVIKWEDRKYDFAGCFRLVTSMANYHHPQDGNANDLILSSLYDIVRVARDILNLKIKRSEEVILVVYECLAALSKDAFRVSQLLEKYDLLAFLQKELQVLDQFPLRGVRAAIAILHASCQGLTSRYIVTLIPLLRESLGKVSRVFSSSQCDEEVRRAHWTLTKSAMIYRTTVDASFRLGDEDPEAGPQVLGEAQVHIETFLRTGQLLPLLSEGQGEGKGVDSAALVEYLREKHPLEHSEQGTSLAHAHALRASAKALQASSLSLSQGEGEGGFSHACVAQLGLQDAVLDDLRTHRYKAARRYASAPAHGSTSSPQGNCYLAGEGRGEAPASSSLVEASNRVMLVPRPVPGPGPGPVPGRVSVSVRPGSGDLPGELGQYSHCGVTSHGSLRLPPPGQALGEEGEGEGERLWVSQLSAREEGLRDLVAQRKGKAGFLTPSPREKLPLRLPSPKPATSQGQQGRVGARRAKGQRAAASSSSSPLPQVSVGDMPALKYTRPSSLPGPP